MALESNLQSLADEVANNSKTLCDYLTSRSSSIPSFSPKWDDYPDLPPHVNQARKRLSEAASATAVLASGPSENIRSTTWQFPNPAILLYLLRFKVPQSVPLHGQISYEQLALACSTSPRTLKRILRYCLTLHLFFEPDKDHIAHNAFSAVLVKDYITRLENEYVLEEHFPAAAKFVPALERWPEANQTNHTAWNLAEETDLSYFEFLARPEQKWRAKRYDEAMRFLRMTPGWDLQCLLEGYDWRNAQGLLADIGGSFGEIAVELLRMYPNLRVLVEDLPHVIAEAQVPEEVQDRMSFLGHDFFQPQPSEVLRTETFLLRCVLHDHTDNNAATIIRNLVPGLEKHNARLLIIDPVALEPGAMVSRAEKAIRTSDISMMMKLGGKQRCLDDWKDVLRMASPQLKLEKTFTPEGSTLSLLIVHMEK